MTRPFPRIGALLALLAGAILLAAPLEAQEQSRNAPGAVIEGYPFPDTVAGLRRRQTITYNKPGEGFSVRYANGNLSWADVYVYDRERNLSSPSREDIKNEMSDVLRAIVAARELGRYEDLKIEEAKLEENAASARLLATAGGKRHLTFAFLTVAHGNFVKIRFSTRDVKAGRKQAEAFRNATFNLIRSTKPVIEPRRDPRYI